jgi:ADP-dependent NAD(P)H-hydrate dehydratase / NAD(P)H-hydrate epimerase
MILSCAAMRAVEEGAFADGISAEQLMEEAGAAIARAVQRTFPTPGLCLAVFGKGNNGGDALVAARILGEAGWQVRLIGAFPKAAWNQLVKKHFNQASGWVKPGELRDLEGGRGEPLIVLDGLLGIGGSGPLRDDIAVYTRAINQLRARSNAHVFALDLPTGLDADAGAPDPACVIADTTLTIGFPKIGLLADEATDFVGRLRILPLAELSKRTGNRPVEAIVASAENLRGKLPRRRFDTHKGDYGRVGIIAGSPGMLGAAALCAEACVRSGAGLVTLYATPDVADRLSVITAPEVMVREVKTISEVAVEGQDAVAMGPGLGQRYAAEIVELIRNVGRPMVIDADALNCLSANPAALAEARGERVLTPHPGEMARLAPDLAAMPRREIARIFNERYPTATLLLKGARTLVAQAGSAMVYNSTGTAGMATGGMGDVLTGVIASLIAQGIAPFEAAQVGAWVCGRAGELAIDEEMESEESLTASRLLQWLGPAFRALRSASA